MKLNRHGEEKVWWIAGLTAIVALSAVALLLTVRREVDLPQPKLTSKTSGTEIGLTRLVRSSESNLVAAEAEFFDPTPLFLPTKWNSNQNELPVSNLRNPGQMFQDFPSRLTFTEEGLRLKFPKIGQIPEVPVDAIPILDPHLAYSGIGRGYVSPPVLMKRGGYMEVRRAASGERVLSDALPVMAIPVGNWHPLELLGVINTAGLVGHLSLVESSGVDDIDATIRDYLVKTMHLGERLSPGFYRISVGP